MKRAYLEGTVYATLVVVGLAALMFRSALDTLAAGLPLVLGLGWTLGVMCLVNFAFDLANVWALPLLVGTGAEYGIVLVVRRREAGTAGPPGVSRSTVLAVLLNGLTTIAGFGSLLVAQHRGIFGLGLLLTIGTATSLVAALVVLPALYRLVSPASTGAGPSASATSASWMGRSISMPWRARRARSR
jgi:predicted RND superfamily exporter protein